MFPIATLAEDVAALDTTVDGVRDDDTATKADDQQTIDDAKTDLDAIIAGINDGSLLDPDYSGVEDKLDEVNGTENLNKETLDKIDEIEEALDEIKNDDGSNAKDDQEAVDALEDQLDEIIAGIEDGSATKPDYTGADEALEEAKEKAENNDVTDDVAERIENIEEVLDEIKNDDGSNAKDDQAVVDALEDQLEEIIAGIEDGSLLKPDYTEVDKDLADAKDKANNNDVIDGVKEEIAAIEAELNKIKDDPTSTKQDDQDDVDALEDRLEAIIEGIEDGSLVKPDYDDAENAIENAENVDTLTDEEKAALEDLKEALDEIKNNPTSNKAEDQAAVDEIKDAAQNIVDKYADCENGNHAWGVPELTTAPTAEAQGEYTYTCTICGDTKNVAVDRADYSALDTVVDALEALENTPNLTDDAKATIVEALAKAEALDKNLPADVKEGEEVVIPGKQDIIDALVAELEAIVADVTADIADGSALKPDYTEVDKDLADAKDKAENNDVIDGVKDQIKDIEDALDEIKDDPTSTKKDDQDDVDALEKELEEIIAGIEDGSLVKPDYTDADEAIKEAEDFGNMSDEDKAALEELKKELDEIKNDPTSNKKDDQTAVDNIKTDVDGIFKKYENCAAGNHTYTSKVTNPTCTEQGYTTYTCAVCSHSYKADYVEAKGHIELIVPAVDPTCSSVGLTEGKKCAVCGDVTVAQQEIAKLPHTDADDDGVCDVCGGSGLYDGCACLCHNNHWFWRIVYMIFRIIWKVFGIHQVCACGRIHY